MIIPTQELYGKNSEILELKSETKKSYHNKKRSQSLVKDNLNEIDNFIKICMTELEKIDGEEGVISNKNHSNSKRTDIQMFLRVCFEHKEMVSNSNLESDSENNIINELKYRMKSIKKSFNDIINDEKCNNSNIKNNEYKENLKKSCENSKKSVSIDEEKKLIINQLKMKENQRMLCKALKDEEARLHYAQRIERLRQSELESYEEETKRKNLCKSSKGRLKEAEEYKLLTKKLNLTKEDSINIEESKLEPLKDDITIVSDKTDFKTENQDSSFIAGKSKTIADEFKLEEEGHSKSEKIKIKKKDKGRICCKESSIISAENSKEKIVITDNEKELIDNTIKSGDLKNKNMDVNDVPPDMSEKKELITPKKDNKNIIKQKKKYIKDVKKYSKPKKFERVHKRSLQSNKLDKKTSKSRDGSEEIESKDKKTKQPEKDDKDTKMNAIDKKEEKSNKNLENKKLPYNENLKYDNKNEKVGKEKLKKSLAKGNLSCCEPFKPVKNPVKNKEKTIDENNLDNINKERKKSNKSITGKSDPKASKDINSKFDNNKKDIILFDTILKSDSPSQLPKTDDNLDKTLDNKENIKKTPNFKQKSFSADEGIGKSQIKFLTCCQKEETRDKHPNDQDVGSNEAWDVIPERSNYYRTKRNRKSDKSGIMCCDHINMKNVQSRMAETDNTTHSLPISNKVRDKSKVKETENIPESNKILKDTKNDSKVTENQFFPCAICLNKTDSKDKNKKDNITKTAPNTDLEKNQDGKELDQRTEKSIKNAIVPKTEKIEKEDLDKIIKKEELIHESDKKTTETGKEMKESPSKNIQKRCVLCLKRNSPCCNVKTDKEIVIKNKKLESKALETNILHKENDETEKEVQKIISKPESPSNIFEKNDDNLDEILKSTRDVKSDPIIMKNPLQNESDSTKPLQKRCMTCCENDKPLKKSTDLKNEKLDDKDKVHYVNLGEISERKKLFPSVNCCDHIGKIKSKDIKEPKSNNSEIIDNANKLDRSLMNSRFSGIIEEKKDSKISNKSGCQLCSYCQTEVNKNKNKEDDKLNRKPNLDGSEKQNDDTETAKDTVFNDQIKDHAVKSEQSDKTKEGKVISDNEKKKENKCTCCQISNIKIADGRKKASENLEDNLEKEKEDENKMKKDINKLENLEDNKEEKVNIKDGKDDLHSKKKRKMFECCQKADIKGDQDPNSKTLTKKSSFKDYPLCSFCQSKGNKNKNKEDYNLVKSKNNDKLKGSKIKSNDEKKLEKKCTCCPISNIKKSDENKKASEPLEDNINQEKEDENKMIQDIAKSGNLEDKKDDKVNIKEREDDLHSKKKRKMFECCQKADIKVDQDPNSKTLTKKNSFKDYPLCSFCQSKGYKNKNKEDDNSVKSENNDKIKDSKIKSNDEKKLENKCICCPISNKNKSDEKKKASEPLKDNINQEKENEVKIKKDDSKLGNFEENKNKNDIPSKKKRKIFECCQKADIKGDEDPNSKTLNKTNKKGQLNHEKDTNDKGLTRQIVNNKCCKRFIKNKNKKEQSSKDADTTNFKKDDETIKMDSEIHGSRSIGKPKEIKPNILKESCDKNINKKNSKYKCCCQINLEDKLNRDQSSDDGTVIKSKKEDNIKNKINEEPLIQDESVIMSKKTDKINIMDSQNVSKSQLPIASTPLIINKEKPNFDNEDKKIKKQNKCCRKTDVIKSKKPDQISEIDKDNQIKDKLPITNSSKGIQKEGQNLIKESSEGNVKKENSKKVCCQKTDIKDKDSRGKPSTEADIKQPKKANQINETDTESILKSQTPVSSKVGKVKEEKPNLDNEIVENNVKKEKAKYKCCQKVDIKNEKEKENPSDAVNSTKYKNKDVTLTSDQTKKPLSKLENSEGNKDKILNANEKRSDINKTKSVVNEAKRREGMICCKKSTIEKEKSNEALSKDNDKDIQKQSADILLKSSPLKSEKDNQEKSLKDGLQNDKNNKNDKEIDKLSKDNRTDNYKNNVDEIKTKSNTSCCSKKNEKSKDLKSKSIQDEIQLKKEKGLAEEAKILAEEAKRLEEEEEEERIKLIKEEKIEDLKRKEQLEEQKRQQDKRLRSLEEERKLLKIKCETEAREREVQRLLEKEKRAKEINQGKDLGKRQNQSSKKEKHINDSKTAHKLYEVNNFNQRECENGYDEIISLKSFSNINLQQLSEQQNCNINHFKYKLSNFTSTTNLKENLLKGEYDKRKILKDKTDINENSQNIEQDKNNIFGNRDLTIIRNESSTLINEPMNMNLYEKKMKYEKDLRELERKRRFFKAKFIEDTLKREKIRLYKKSIRDQEIEKHSMMQNLASNFHDEDYYTSTSSSTSYYRNRNLEEMSEEKNKLNHQYYDSGDYAIDTIDTIKPINQNNSNRRNKNERTKTNSGDTNIDKRTRCYNIYNRAENKLKMKKCDERFKKQEKKFSDAKENIILSKSKVQDNATEVVDKNQKENSQMIKDVNKKGICCKESDIQISKDKTIVKQYQLLSPSYDNNIEENSKKQEMLSVTTSSEIQKTVDFTKEIVIEEAVIQTDVLKFIESVLNPKVENYEKDYEEIFQKRIRKSQLIFMEEINNLALDDITHQHLEKETFIDSTIDLSLFEDKEDNDFPIHLDDSENTKFWPTYVYRIKQNILSRMAVACIVKAKVGCIGMQSNLECNILSLEKTFPRLDEVEDFASIGFELKPSTDSFQFNFDPPWRIIIPHVLSKHSKKELIILTLNDDDSSWIELPTSESTYDELKEPKLRYVETKLDKPFGVFIVMTKTRVDSGLINKYGIRLESSSDCRMFVSVPVDAVRISLNITLKINLIDDNFWKALKSKSDKIALEQIICCSHFIDFTSTKKKLVKPANINCFLPLNPEIKKQNEAQAKAAIPSKKEFVIDDDEDDEISVGKQEKPGYTRIQYNLFQKSLLLKGINGDNGNENIRVVCYNVEEDKWNPIENPQISLDKSKEQISMELPIIQSLRCFFVRAKRIISNENIAKSMRLIEHEFSVRNTVIILLKSSSNPVEFILSICAKGRLEKYSSELKKEGFLIESQIAPISVELKEGQIITALFTGNICNRRNSGNCIEFRYHSMFRNNYKFRVKEIDAYAQRAIDHYRGYIKVFTKQLVKHAIDHGELKTRKGQVQYHFVEEDVLMCQLLISIPKKKIINVMPFKNTIFNRQILDGFMTLFSAIAEGIGVSWKELGKVLHISESRLQSIQHHNNENQHERMLIQMLIFWLKGLEMIQNKSELLIQALLEINRNDLVNEIKIYLESDDISVSGSIL